MIYVDGKELEIDGSDDDSRRFLEIFAVLSGCHAILRFLVNKPPR